MRRSDLTTKRRGIFAQHTPGLPPALWRSYRRSVLSIPGFFRRLRALASLPAQVAELRAMVEQVHGTLLTLNHEVHSGAEESLPLFLGYSERLRLDADTAIGAAQVIERQLSELQQTIASLRRDG